MGTEMTVMMTVNVMRMMRCLKLTSSTTIHQPDPVKLLEGRHLCINNLPLPKVDRPSLLRMAILASSASGFVCSIAAAWASHISLDLDT